MGMIALISLVGLYEKRWKYPPMVRKARKLKKKIKKGKKKLKVIPVNNRDELIKERFHKNMHLLSFDEETSTEREIDSLKLKNTFEGVE